MAARRWLLPSILALGAAAVCLWAAGILRVETRPRPTASGEEAALAREPAGPGQAEAQPAPEPAPLPPPAEPTLRLRLVDAATSAPVRADAVTVFGGLRAGQEGAVATVQAQEGELDLFLGDVCRPVLLVVDGFAPARLDLPAAGEGAPHEDLRLRRARELRFRVVERNDRAVPGAWVSFQEPGAGELTVLLRDGVLVNRVAADSRGEGSVRGLPAARLEAVVRAAGQKRQWTLPVDLTGEVTGVRELRTDLELPPPRVGLQVLLCCARPDVEAHSFVGELTAAWLAELGPGRTAWLLDEAARVVVRDAAGQEIARGEIRPEGGAGWRWSAGAEAGTAVLPLLPLHVPAADLTVEAAAAGYGLAKVAVRPGDLAAGMDVVLVLPAQAAPPGGGRH